MTVYDKQQDSVYQTLCWFIFHWLFTWSKCTRGVLDNRV